MVSVSRTGAIAGGLFALFFVALNPPVVTTIDGTDPVFGMAPLYLWYVGWGVFVTVVFVWAASQNAFGLADDQVPPELRRSGEESGPTDRNGPGSH